MSNRQAHEWLDVSVAMAASDPAFTGNDTTTKTGLVQGLAGWQGPGQTEGEI